MKSKLKKITSSPILQSAIFGLLITLLVYFVWDAPITQYNVQIEPFESGKYNTIHWFAGDFNNDGNSERIRVHNGLDSKSMDVVHYDNDGNITEHYHFTGSEWGYHLKPAIYDIDGDNKQELLFFTVRNDSIFFNVFSLSNFNLVVNEHYFNTFERKREEYSYNSEFFCFGDFDNNGVSELFFQFDAGFGLYPRGIFKMEFPSLKLTASPTEYMNLYLSKLKDINADGIPEIFTQCSAPANVDITYKKYTDTISYITVLNYNLNFVFDPIPFNGRFSSITTIPCNTNDSIFYASFECRSKSTEPLNVMTLTTKGEIINQRKWDNLQNIENIYRSFLEINGKTYVSINNVGIFQLTPTLKNLPEEFSYNPDIPSNYKDFIDLNNDGWDEWVYWNIKDEITIYNEKTNEKISFDSPNPIAAIIEIYPYYQRHKLIKFMVDTGTGYFFLNYERNHFYFVLYLIYFIVFLFGSGLVFAILHIQKRTIEKKWTTEKQLSELQFNAVKNQLNPHFLFNALNSVAYMINEGRNDEAYDFLAVNSRMIQRVMNDAKEVKRPLKDELQFTKDYVKIQKHRFKNRFDVVFHISEKVNQKIEVPKMCIHTYVENAFKHGFRNTKTGGSLNVEIEPFKRHGIFIKVSDNGMGRKAASAYKDSSGNGINIMNEFYSLFEKYHGYKIDYSIEDNKPVGTVVELRIEEQLGR